MFCLHCALHWLPELQMSNLQMSDYQMVLLALSHRHRVVLFHNCISLGRQELTIPRYISSDFWTNLQNGPSTYVPFWRFVSKSEQTCLETQLLST